MSKIGTSILRGLNEAVDYAEGKANHKAFRVHVPNAVSKKAISELIRGKGKSFTSAKALLADLNQKGKSETPNIYADIGVKGL